MTGGPIVPQSLPVIDAAFHDEVLRGLERDDARRAAPLLHDVRSETPLTDQTSHHESYHSNEPEGAI
jgi:hypothetical protein